MRHRGLVFCYPQHRQYIFPPEILERIEATAGCECPVFEPKEWRKATELLKEAEFIVGTWGAPLMDEAFLAGAPKLKGYFYAAGSLRKIVTDAVWDRGIVVSNARLANAIPVSEYTLATVLLSLKRFWHFSRDRWRNNHEKLQIPVPGVYQSRVGLVSLGAIGRAVAKLLRQFEIQIFAYDPFIDKAEARALGVELLSLEELFQTCDVVSLHLPWIPETERMITGRLVGMMKEGATLINTSRGAVIVEDELAKVLAVRHDLSAVLDVMWPEPPAHDSPLLALSNVVTTPHVAGSIQRECVRMGSWMADELKRFYCGEPLLYSLTREMMPLMA